MRKCLSISDIHSPMIRMRCDTETMNRNDRRMESFVGEFTHTKKTTSTLSGIVDQRTRLEIFTRDVSKLGHYL